MAERISVADTLTQIFAKLAQSIPADPNTGVPLLHAWTAVLGGAEQGPLDVVVSIGQVSAMLVKLESQIKASVKLRDDQKRSALHTTSAFHVLFELRRFHEPSGTFRQACNEIQRGNLGILGHSLGSEFSEPRLEKPDADDLAAALAEVKNLLADSSLELDLRINLAKHVDAMLWWLAHPEMASMQDIFETIGSAMVVAAQMKDRDPKRESSDPSPGKSIFSKITEMAAKLAKLIGVTAGAVEAANELSTQAGHLLQALH